MNASFADMLRKASESPKALSVPELARLLAAEDEGERRALHAAAYAVKVRHVGRRVSVRGLVEAGNVCAKDCLYCGLRRSNAAVARYSLAADEILHVAEVAKARGYASLVIQSGEVESDVHTRFVEDVLRRIAPLDLGVTLSLGEQTEDVFRRWKDAGASRYLLRIETSDPAYYAKLHPAGHDWKRRVACLETLKRLGYQLGTGVMCALPGQTPEMLARDIAFFGEIDADMLGMGPYIPHPDAPLGVAPEAPDDAARLRLGLDLIAVARLHLHDVNIAAATSLQALAPDGRERGLLAGANVLMPNLTDVQWRAGYQLYPGKPNLDESAEDATAALERSVASVGESILWNARGDSPHFRRTMR